MQFIIFTAALNLNTHLLFNSLFYSLFQFPVILNKQTEKSWKQRALYVQIIFWSLKYQNIIGWITTPMKNVFNCISEYSNYCESAADKKKCHLKNIFVA